MYAHMSLLSESKRFNDFTPEEKRQIFNVFTQSYVKATGASWDERKFYSRAGEWLFFGDPTGFITLRPQKSGYYKLTGVAGSPKAIMRAMQELTATNYPIWGMLTQDLANMLIKRFGFRMPNRLEGFIISKLISNNVFGNVEFKRNPDGSITFNYADVGEATKVFVGSKEYYRKVRMDVVKRVFTGKPAANEEINEDVLDEKRAVENYFEDSFKLVSEYLRRYGYENTYASFRKTANTTFINRSNSYSTPTGFYMYPFKNYAEKIAASTDMQTFMKVFPFTPDSKFCFLFTIANYDNLLSSLNPDVEKIHGYVRKIKEIYGKKKPAIATLCDLYFTPEGFTSRAGYSHKNEFQKFWIFLYEIAFELRNNNAKYEPDKYESNYQERPSSITIIANDIGLAGFIDDGCQSIIHGGEPCQGVLLSNVRETLSNLRIVPIYQKYDAPLPIDNPDAPTGNSEKNRNKYQKYLAGKLQARSVSILGNEYQSAIKNRMPFIVFFNDYTPLYIDRDGNKTVRGLDAEKIIATDRNADEYDDTMKTKRTAYINSLFNTKYDEVRPFGKYGGDIAFAIGTDGTYSFINKEGKPDITDVDILKITDSKTRAIYLNQIRGEDIYDSVGSFGEFGGELARAQTLEGTTVYINKAGDSDISKIDVTKVTDSSSRALIINQKLGKKIYSNVGDFNKFGQGIAVAYSEKTGGQIFINTEGRPSIKGVKIISINDSTLRAVYFNQKFHKKTFSFIGNYDKYGAGIAIGKYVSSGDLVFINTLGQPALDQVDIDKIDDTNIRALYLNQKFGTDFTSVGIFDRIGDNVAFAVREGGEVVFIDREGKPNMGNVNIHDISDSHIRAVYVNKLLNTDYTHIGRFGELGGDVAFATNPENLTYEFINKEGKKDTTGVELDKIRDAATRAAYFNQKYGTKYESVGDFSTYGENAAKAFEPEKGRFFINREGVPDTSGVDINELDDSYDRATVYNQRFGTNYDEIGKFNVYGKGIAVANDVEGKRNFVNNKGKKTTVGVNIKTLPDSLHALYINQKYKKDYKTISGFGQYGENAGIARTKDNRNIFINREGKPDITGVDPEKIKNMNSNVKATYFNTINGTNFSDIYESLTNNQTNVLFATIPNSGGYAFVDNKGKPTIKIKNLQMLKDQYGETTVNDIIKTTKKMLSGEFKENYSPLHSLINEELVNYFQN
jgi:hypothetical protein